MGREGSATIGVMTGRNDACPCGSGKKFKKCCAGSEAALAAAQPRLTPQRRFAGPTIKTQEEIEGVRRAGALAARILREACDRVAPGVTTNQIDQWVRDMTLDAGAYPAPLNYPHPPTDPRSPRIAPRAFPKSVCTSINDVVCHGIPDDTVLREGDIVNVDVTCNLDGFFGDTSLTVYVGDVSEEARRLTETCRESLQGAIARVRDGASFWDIGDAIQALADARGFSVVREFTGHGIGRIFHEPPPVLHYRSSEMKFPMRAGMIFTIEPMLNVGSHRVKMDPRDHWTARTADGSLSAQFEHTILVTQDGAEVLTRAA
jgi:methionyl aminopeptidase